MFWQRKSSTEADAYFKRIYQIMMFAASLAGKSKAEFVQALRNELGIRIGDVHDAEDRTWPDTKISDLAVSFSLDFTNPHLVSQIQITGYGVIDTLLICANCLENQKPHCVNFGVDLMGQFRPTPALAIIVAKKLTQHPDFECLTIGGNTLLLQRNRNQ